MDGSILVIEDDAAIRELRIGNLRNAGYTVACARDLAEARTRVGEMRPDLVLLDRLATGGQALSYARQLRGDPRTSALALIVIGTDPAQEPDTVAALESGADDCIRKLLPASEMLARIRAVLRRSAPQQDQEVIEFAGLRFDPAARRVSAGAIEVELCAIEYRLLRYFMTHPDRILGRSKLLDEVWGDHVCVEERAVDIHVRRLRRALEPSGHGALIETIRGMGYRFLRRAAVAPVAAVVPAVRTPWLVAGERRATWRPDRRAGVLLPARPTAQQAA